MDVIRNLRIFWGIISVCLGSVVVLYIFFKSKRSKDSYFFLILITLGLIWILCEMLQTDVANLNLKWRLEQLKFFTVSFIGESSLLFSASYVNSSIIRSKKPIAISFVVSLVLYIFMLTNKHHHLFYTSFKLDRIEFGILFWLFCIKTYLLATIVLFLLIKHYLKHKEQRRKIILIMSAIAMPFVSGFIGVVLNYMKVFPMTTDLTIVGMPIVIIAIVAAIFRHNFLNIMPDALKKAFESMKEAAVITDSDNIVVDFNKEFEKIFGKSFGVHKNDNIRYFMSYILNMSNNNQTDLLNKVISKKTAPFTIEIEVDLESKKVLNINFAPIINSKGLYIGEIVSFNDITEYKNLLEEINDKNSELTAMNEELTAINEELTDANQRLTEYVEVVEELSYQKERNRIAQEVHDTLGHTLTSVMVLMKVGKISMNKDMREAQDKLEQAVEIAAEGLEQLRFVASGGFYKGENIIEKIEALVVKTAQTGLKIEFNVYGEEYYKKIPQTNAMLKINETIYKTCKECLTNSIRHGQARDISIILRFNKNGIKLFIVDNGKGCVQIKKGMGIKGMEERARAVNGILSCGSFEEGGFSVTLKIPLMNGGVTYDKSCDC